MVMFPRNISQRILQALKDTPVVLIHGARQTGKSTLAQWIASAPHPAIYLTLDTVGVFSAANEDPAGFLAGLEGSVVIDEFQLAPGLFRAIKVEVDRNRRPGRFLLTGSANVMLIPQLSESLAGRMEIHQLWPLSQGELAGVQEHFIDSLFQPNLNLSKSGPRRETHLYDKVMAGGFPEAVSRKSVERRQAWFGAYITTILQRDVRNIADIEGITQLPRLLKLLALQTASLLNMSNLARSAGIANTTLKRYLTLLEASFLVHLLPAWSGNVRKRLIRTPKVLFCDSGLLAYLLDVTETHFLQRSTVVGPLLENFVGAELLKQMTWNTTPTSLFYYRTTNGREVDYVLEDLEGRIVGIEVKASASVDRSDLKGLEDLRETIGAKFYRGIILYTGSESIPFGRQLHALPINALWQLGAENH